MVAPAGPNLAVDGFSGRSPTELGTADTGGAWTLSGTGTNLDGKRRRDDQDVGAGSGPSAYLNTVSGTDVDATVTLAFDKTATGGGTYGSLAVRHTHGLPSKG